MIDVTMQAKEIYQVAEDMRRFHRPARKIVVSTLNVILRDLTREVKKRAGKIPYPRYKRRLQRSIASVLKVSTGLPLEIRAEVFSPLPYAIDVEEGKKVGSVADLAELTEWVAVRASRGEITLNLGSTSTRTRSGRKKSAEERRDSAAKRAAFFIQRKIKMRGTEGYFIFAKSLQNQTKSIDTRLVRAADQMASILAGGRNA